MGLIIQTSNFNAGDYLLKSGGTMTGPLILNADPTLALGAATKQYVDTAVVGLWDDRGNYDASGNVFPSTGGSGPAGAIRKGDIWTISVAGTLGGVAVAPGDTVRALIDTPGQTAGNWALGEGNLGYTPITNVLPSAQIIVGNASNVAAPVSMSGEVTITNAGVTTVDNAAVIGKVITGYTSGNGTVAATDTILQAIQKLNGNTGLRVLKAGDTMTGPLINSTNGALSAPTIKGTGTWITGGTTTTCKPYWLIEPSTATSTGWSTNGTGLGINAVTGFTGNLIDAQINGVSKFKITSTGGIQFDQNTGGSISYGTTSGIVIKVGGANTTQIYGAGTPIITFADSGVRVQVNANGAAPTGFFDIFAPTQTGSGAVTTLNITNTWNTSGTVTGISLSITNTASNAASLLINLLAGAAGATKMFSITALGKISAPNQPTSNAGLTTGDLYVDTAANILSNGDKIVAFKV